MKFWGEIHFYGDKILVSTISLKQNFSGHNKIGEHCPLMPLLATGLPVKQKFCTWMKILLHFVFG